ncbi:MAG: helix-turn-helix transcriptional regulator [Hyphomicrobiales bacterium]|nr:helix-turn-helix transcriptional regulator [Hyphomicrobiales bacterium]
MAETNADRRQRIAARLPQGIGSAGRAENRRRKRARPPHRPHAARRREAERRSGGRGARNSPPHLARRLSAEGLTFKRLVKDLRFEMATDMLAKSDAPMARIAEMLGYSDQTVFSRAFSNQFGRPPSHLRKAQS